MSIATKNEPKSQGGSELPKGNTLTFLEPVVFSSKRLTFVFREYQQVAAGSFLVAKVAPFYLLLTVGITTRSVVQLSLQIQKVRMVAIDLAFRQPKIIEDAVTCLRRPRSPMLATNPYQLSATNFAS